MKELYEKVAADRALQAKFNEIMSAAEKDGREATEIKLIAFAKEAGFEVTVEEMTEFFHQLSEEHKGQLSESELDMVAGGKASGSGLALSLGTLGTFCAVGSALAVVQDFSCGKLING